MMIIIIEVFFRFGPGRHRQSHGSLIDAAAHFARSVIVAPAALPDNADAIRQSRAGFMTHDQHIIGPYDISKNEGAAGNLLLPR